MKGEGFDKIWDITEKETLSTVVAEILQMLKTVNLTEATVVALHGDLGAGKTTFIQALAEELGVEEVVTSPTFVVMKNYNTKNASWPLLVHIDAYRLESAEELRVLRVEEELVSVGTMVCIEWAERIKEILPKHTFHLYFSLQGEKRSLTLTREENI